ncbi:MAG: hypothetical protein R3228_11940, partial [Halioglobus sp.]|nr:hypothetical protein [Halioglobus sp.]
MHTAITISGFAFLCCALVVAPVDARGFYAAQITPTNVERIPDGGLDAIGGLGDWFMTNGRLCAIVSDKTHATYLALHGGALVDLWHCDRANDQWSTAHTQLNLQKEEIPPTAELTAGYSAQQAWIETRGDLEGLHTRVRFTLGGAATDALSVTTTVTRQGQGKALGMFGAIVLHPRASLRPYSIDTTDPAYSLGFEQPDVDTADRASILSSIGSTNLQVLLGSPGHR